MTQFAMSEEEAAARGLTRGDSHAPRTAASDTGRHDGGPAFPQNDAAVNRINNEAGMSLRDYFAGIAFPEAVLQSRLSNGQAPPQDVALRAYGYADAMLKARDKEKA